MHGLGEIRRMNANARVIEKPVRLAAHAVDERDKCVDAAWRNYHAGAYTLAQLNEELADIRSTYE